MSMVSHDMCTPLSSITAAQNSLTKGVCGELPERASRKLNDARGNVNRLLTLLTTFSNYTALGNKLRFSTLDPSHSAT
jgi:K+-sensing histidine kinase KdpD